MDYIFYFYFLLLIIPNLLSLSQTILGLEWYLQSEKLSFSQLGLWCFPNDTM
jgi:hypothetical protein